MQDFQSIGTRFFPSQFTHPKLNCVFLHHLFPLNRTNGIFCFLDPKIDEQIKKHSFGGSFFPLKTDIADAMKMSIFNRTTMATSKIASELTRTHTRTCKKMVHRMEERE